MIIKERAKNRPSIDFKNITFKRNLFFQLSLNWIWPVCSEVTQSDKYQISFVGTNFAKITLIDAQWYKLYNAIQFWLGLFLDFQTWYNRKIMQELFRKFPHHCLHMNCICFWEKKCIKYLENKGKQKIVKAVDKNLIFLSVWNLIE